MIDTLRKQIDSLVEYVTRRAEVERPPLKAKFDLTEFETRLVPAAFSPGAVLAAFFDGSYGTSNSYGPESASVGVVAFEPAGAAEALVQAQSAPVRSKQSDPPAAATPSAIAVVDGQVFVVSSQAGNPYNGFGPSQVADDTSTIQAINPATGAATPFTVKGRETLALAPSADGKQLLAAWYDGTYGTANSYGPESAMQGVSSFNPATGAETVLFSEAVTVRSTRFGSVAAPKPDGLAAVGDKVFVAFSQPGNPYNNFSPAQVADDTSSIRAIDPATRTAAPFAVKGRETLALTASADGKQLLAAFYDGTYGTGNSYGPQSATQGVVAFDPATGAETVLFAQPAAVRSNRFDPPAGPKPSALAASADKVYVAFSQPGNPYNNFAQTSVADDSSTILAINPVTHAAAPFAVQGRETRGLAVVPPPLNTAPTITPKAGFAARTVPSGTRSVGEFRFEFGDAQTPAGALTVTVTSSNPALVPDGPSGVTLDRAGPNGVLSVKPLPNASGVATISVTVTDAGGLSATSSFVLTVSPPPPAATVVPADVLALLPALGPNARVTTVDLNGDGVADFVGVTGAGTPNLIQVLDGKTRTILSSFSPFESAFTGGLYVASGDLLGTGKVNVIVSPDLGGGPVVAVYDGTKLAAGLTGDAAQVARFFGIEDPAFRGGVRVAAGVVNGTSALIVAAGFGGGPRIAIFNGASVATGAAAPAHLVADFFAFENTLRNGSYVASGDLNGDGVADLAFGGGPGGGPRVRVIDGKSLLGASGFGNLDLLPPASQLANFFVGDPAARDGVRVAFRDVYGDHKADLATQGGGGGTVRVFKPGSLLARPNDPAPDSVIDPLTGVFVG